MIEINPARFRTPPWKHQAAGIRELVTRPAFALFDDPRTGKSKQVVDAACVLFEAGAIDAVVVVAPADCRSVWLDPELGQIREHAWVRSEAIEYHAKSTVAWSDGHADTIRTLTWVVTNYEFIRPIKKNDARLDALLALLEPFRKILLVFDESSALSERRTGQFDACFRLRRRAARCIILNGTPISDNPLDLWAQFEILDHRILGRRYANFFHFRYSHCNLGGWHNKQILGWRDLEKVQAIIKPYAVRNLITDCHDLPPKVATLQEVPLSAATWGLYKKLRDEAILALPDRELILEVNAGVRVMRLCQVTSGHVSLAAPPATDGVQFDLFAEPELKHLSDEKISWTFDYLTRVSRATASIVWCRFRPERERLAAKLRAAGVETYEIHGGQKKELRAAAKAAFHSSNLSTTRRIVIAQPHAGGVGIDLAAATEEIYQSNDPSLKARLQSEERPRHPRQTAPCAVIDLLATGPAGQKTVDHTVLRALRKKEELAAWTCAAWRRALIAEKEGE